VNKKWKGKGTASDGKLGGAWEQGYCFDLSASTSILLVLMKHKKEDWLTALEKHFAFTH